jgi:glycosyltransferase involved in cell wall biosynthesis
MLRLAAKRAGMTEAWQLGDLTVSMLRGEEGRQRKELERLAEWLTEMRPDVVCLSNVLLIGLARRIREVTGAPVVCTLQGEDGFLDALTEPHRTQAWQLVSERARDVVAFIPPSRYYAQRMCERASLPAEKVHVVPNGILLDGYEPAIPQDPPVLGYLARMCKDKGLHVLVEAFLLLRAWGRVPGLRLRVAGTVTAADEEFVQTLKHRLAEKGLANQAEFLPNVDRDTKVSFLRNLTVFSAPAAYGEAFGLYILEALAAGVPVVQPRHAAFPELIEATGGGLLCEPNDPESLARTIEELLLDPQKARQLGTTGRAIVFEKFGVEQMTRGVLDVFQRTVE